MQTNRITLSIVFAMAVVLVSCGQSTQSSGNSSSGSVSGLGNSVYSGSSTDASGNARCSQDSANLTAMGTLLETPIVGGVEQNGTILLKFSRFPTRFFSNPGSSLQFYSLGSDQYPSGTPLQLSFVVQVFSSSGVYQPLTSSLLTISDSTLQGLAASAGVNYSTFYQNFVFSLSVQNAGALLIDAQAYYNGNGDTEVTALAPKFAANPATFNSLYPSVAAFHPLRTMASNSTAAAYSSAISAFCF